MLLCTLKVGQRKTLNVLLYLSLPNALEAGSLTESGARQTETRPSCPLVSASHGSEATGTQPAFYVGAGDLNSGPHTSQQVLFSIEPSPHLNIGHF